MFKMIFRKEINKRALELADLIVEVREYNLESETYHDIRDAQGIPMGCREHYTGSRLVDINGEDVTEYYRIIKNEDEVLYRYFNQ
jgi:hypothetical protein